MIAISLDLYNQKTAVEICHTIKAVQGGDDYPRVLIISEVANDDSIQQSEE